jgi:serine/threonine protein kinase
MGRFEIRRDLTHKFCTLKLIDFGIGKTISIDTTNIERTNQVGTLNYMSPESLKMNKERKAFKVGRAADVWSLGCILYQLVYNQLPFPQMDWVQKIQSIIDDRYQIEFPTVPGRSDFGDLMDIMKKCLQRDSKARPTIDERLRHQYVTFGAIDLSGIGSQLLSFLLQIQDDYPNCDFDGPAADQVFDCLAAQFRNKQEIQFPEFDQSEYSP